MIYAVFLCDRQWEIKKVRLCCPEFDLKEGDFLTKLVCEKEKLQQNPEEKYFLELTFAKQDCVVSAIFHSYKEAHLVILANINNNQEFQEFIGKYPGMRNGQRIIFSGCFIMNII